MREFNEDTLTQAVVDRLKKSSDPRFKEIMTSAVKYLHAFAREVHLTEEEWFEGIKFLTAVGQKCDDKRQEFILLSDILGLSMMIVALNHKTVPGATEATVLGPFFAHGAKEYEYGADLRESASVKGEDVYVSGRVMTLDGKPLPNAALDIWQAKADGIYDVQTEGGFELRGRVKFLLGRFDASVAQGCERRLVMSVGSLLIGRPRRQHRGNADQHHNRH